MDTRSLFHLRADATKKISPVIECLHASAELKLRLAHSIATIEALMTSDTDAAAVLRVIRGMKERMQLPALDALMEDGHGVTRVAKEVRALDRHTVSATEEMQTLIAQLQQNAVNAIAAIEQPRITAQNCEKLGDTAVNALVTVRQAIETIGAIGRFQVALRRLTALHNMLD